MHTIRITGKILWEHELEASPEGLASVYEAGGREYVAFCASGSAEPDTPPTQRISFMPGMVAAQGYYVFALPSY